MPIFNVHWSKKAQNPAKGAPDLIDEIGLSD